MHSFRFFCFLALILAFSCQRGTGSSQQILQEATQLHEEAQTIEDKIKSSIANLVQQGNSIQIQGRALTGEEMDRVNAINRLQGSYYWYQENFMKLPAENSAMNPKQILEQQRALRDTILSIQQRVQQLQKS